MSAKGSQGPRLEIIVHETWDRSELVGDPWQSLFLYLSLESNSSLYSRLILHNQATQEMPITIIDGNLVISQTGREFQTNNHKAGDHFGSFNEE